jgi:rSAM/selenodomain-associated transferase 2
VGLFFSSNLKLGHKLKAADVGLRISLIVPVLNEAAGLTAHLLALQPLRSLGHEVIVVDGGSADNTVALAQSLADHVLQLPAQQAGRAAQMNAGAAAASGAVLLFLHADTLLPPQAQQAVQAAFTKGARWGRFDVRISGHSRWLPVVGAAMNLRSRLTGIATGDQALFVQRALFMQLGGYAKLPLMEDIDLSRRLCAIGRPACLRQRVITSGRRWDGHGAWPTIWLMWRLRWLYWRGADPAGLALLYRHARQKKV